MPKLIVSIESSCDDSSIAITDIDSCKLIIHKKISQEKLHYRYGGVVPELASRMHSKELPTLLDSIKPYTENIVAVAVTSEPGLNVSLLQGITMAKAMSLILKVPIISVNHLLGHIYSPFIEKISFFSHYSLLLSGGHSMLIEAKGISNNKILINSLDDSFGESFDKASKMLGFGYPGGPIIEGFAEDIDDDKVNFTLPLKSTNKIAFSFSGLKNAFRLEVEKNIWDKHQLSYSFQKACVNHIIDRIRYLFKKNGKTFSHLSIVGGASANKTMQDSMKEFLSKNSLQHINIDMQYSSDNAAMIGRVAIELYKSGIFTDHSSLESNPNGYSPFL